MSTFQKFKILFHCSRHIFIIYPLGGPVSEHGQILTPQKEVLNQSCECTRLPLLKKKGTAFQSQIGKIMQINFFIFKSIISTGGYITASVAVHCVLSHAGKVLPHGRCATGKCNYSYTWHLNVLKVLLEKQTRTCCKWQTSTASKLHQNPVPLTLFWAWCSSPLNSISSSFTSMPRRTSRYLHSSNRKKRRAWPVHPSPRLVRPTRWM